VNYLDANFAAALHFHIRGQTELAEKFVRRNSAPFLFSELAELECRRAFAVRSGKPDSENWRRLLAFIDEGIWRQDALEWRPVTTIYKRLVDLFGNRLKAGALDTLHIAHALHSGCNRFLSFDSDSNARVLAASCRLKVYPELTSREKGLVARR